MVLSDDERRTIERIRTQMAADDPEFVAVFETRLPRSADRHAVSRAGDWLCTIVMWLVIVLGVLQLMDGVVGGAIFMAAIATGAYLVRRHGLLPPQKI